MWKEDAKNFTHTGCDEYGGQRNASLLERNRASLEVNVGGGDNYIMEEKSGLEERKKVTFIWNLRGLWKPFLSKTHN